MAQYSNLEWQYPGLADVGSYQMSGIPYLSSSITVPANTSTPLKIQFPNVTKFITIINTGSVVTPNLKVGFSLNGISGSGTNFLTLAYGESYTGEWRVEDMFLYSAGPVQTSASIIAALTQIPRGVPSLVSTGNNWSGSAGIG